jgi:hypothetical protein
LFFPSSSHNLHPSRTFFLPYFLHQFPSFVCLIFNSYKNNLFFPIHFLYHIRMLVLLIYNMIGGINGVTEGFLLHVNMWFVIELVNLLLFSSMLRKLVTKKSMNSIIIQSCQVKRELNYPIESL